MVAGATSIATGIAVNIVSSGSVSWTVGFVLGGGLISATVIEWRRAVHRPQRDDPPPPTLGVNPDWVVMRAAEAQRLTAALRGRRPRHARVVGVCGAGGFGKSTLVEIVCAAAVISRTYRQRIYQVTVGRNARAPSAIADKVNEVVEFITGVRPSFSDPRMAGQHLGRVLDQRPRVLLVIDDVWYPDQLEPFMIGGRNSTRLVTTRQMSVLPPDALRFPLGEMARDEAWEVLSRDLSTLDSEILDELLRAIGGWPLLLRLTNRMLYEHEVTYGGRAGAEAVLDRLRSHGPSAFDEQPDTDGEGSDVDVPSRRSSAVRSTIEAATALLPADGPRRFAELGIFPEVVATSLAMAARLWQWSADLDQLAASRLSQDLARLSLLTVTQAASGETGFSLHTMVRAFVRHELGPEELRRLNAGLVTVLGSDLPQRPTVAWWELTDADEYAWSKLVYHMVEAGLERDAQVLVSDLRWLCARLVRSGVAGLEADLAQVRTPITAAVRRKLSQSAHLLGPTRPPQAVAHILLNRLQGDPEWADAAMHAHERLPGPKLRSRWPLPDTPDPAMRRILTADLASVNALVVSVDGALLVSAGSDGVVRVWDASSGSLVRALSGGTGSVDALSVAGHGGLLAGAGSDGAVWLWEMQSGRVVGSVLTRVGPVSAVALAADGGWVACAGGGGVQVRWLSEQVADAGFADGAAPVEALAAAPDGSWLAGGMTDGTVRIWQLTTGSVITTLTGHNGAVRALAASPDGQHLASASGDGVIQWRSVPSGDVVLRLVGHQGPVRALAVAADGKWLASTGNDRTVRTWDLESGAVHQILKGHTGAVRTVATAVVSGDSWLTSGGTDGAVRIWDFSPLRAIPEDPLPPSLGGSSREALAIFPDRHRLAVAGGATSVEIWNIDRREIVNTMPPIGGGTNALVVSVDGALLVSAGSDGVVRVWDASSGSLVRALSGGTDRWTRCRWPDTVGCWPVRAVTARFGCGKCSRAGSSARCSPGWVR